MFEQEMKAKMSSKSQGERTYLGITRSAPKVRCVLRIREKQETN